MKHIHDFIEHGMGWSHESSPEELYARWFFMLHRLPAIELNAFDKWISQYELYCTWNGKRWRVTGASRMGDVWLHKDLKKTNGYTERVDVAECSEWSEKP